MEQIQNIANLPFVEHMAIMPDAHQGMACPIGGVVACRNVVVPNFVGSDAGCRIVVWKTSLKKSDLLDKNLRLQILNKIRRSIPVGFDHNHPQRMIELNKEWSFLIEPLIRNIGSTHFLQDKNLELIVYEQLGTLGSGNHYASIDYDQNEDVWIMVHSGSRNIGYKLNEYYNKIAMDLNEKYFSNTTVPFLPVDTEIGEEYLKCLRFALDFALANRTVLVSTILKEVESFFPNMNRLDDVINIHHNYASLEHFENSNLWIHRKGAVNAAKGTLGVIPGSMGTASYIVQGLGNELSINSSSHGAGRKMGRKEFNRQHNTPEILAQIDKLMENVVYVDFSKEVSRSRKETGLMDISECPLAYKDIDTVMAEQSDLVKPLNKLMPLINLKG